MALNIQLAEQDPIIIEPKTALDTIYGCDLFSALGRAVDEALEGAALRGLSAKVELDPALHTPRLIDSGRAQHALQATVAAAAMLAARGATALAVRIGLLSQEVVEAAVSVRFEPSKPLNQPVVRDAVHLAKGLGAALTANMAGDRLTLTLALPAPKASPRWLLVTDDDGLGDEITRAAAVRDVVVQVSAPGETQRLWRQPFAAVLVDLFTDELDVFATPRWASAPVYAVAGCDTAAGRWALRNAGFAGVLARPFDAPALAELPAGAGAA